jgi:hypothetical protein
MIGDCADFRIGDRLCLRGFGKRARRHRSAPGARIVRHSPRAGGDQAGRLPQRAPRGLAALVRDQMLGRSILGRSLRVPGEGEADLLRWNGCVSVRQAA